MDCCAQVLNGFPSSFSILHAMGKGGGPINHMNAWFSQFLLFQRNKWSTNLSWFFCLYFPSNAQIGHLLVFSNKHFNFHKILNLKASCVCASNLQSIIFLLALEATCKYVAKWQIQIISVLKWGTAGHMSGYVVSKPGNLGLLKCFQTT